MTNPFNEAGIGAENSYAQFNALESAAPSALSEFPQLVLDSRSTTSDALTQFDSNQSQPFEITNGDGQVLASSCPQGGCPCSEYAVRGWNRNAAARNNYAGDDGSGDDAPGGDCGPGDGGGCDSGDGGCDSGGGGGLLRGLLGRFGRGGLLGRLFGGGGLGLARAFRR